MIKHVYIEKGTYHHNPVEAGVYEFFSEIRPATLKEKEKALGVGKLNVLLNGRSRGVWVFDGDYYFCDENGERLEEQEEQEKPTTRKKEERDAMIKRINNRFDVMDIMSKGLINGSIRSLIVSGAPGIGKTHGLNKFLKEQHDSGAISYNMVNGKMTAIGLYENLYHNRSESSVTMIDDVDVFSDMDTLNILKAALDTGEDRKICWNSASTYLEDNKIPKEFDYKGTVVFITNVDLDREIDKNTKLSPHVNALLSRSVYLDLGVHSNEEIMIRIEQVVRNTKMLQKEGLTENEINELIAWLNDNVSKLRTVSLRTAIFIASFIGTDRQNWRMLADTTMIKPEKHYH